VLFATTSMPVGGAETLLVNLVQRLDRERIQPELVCLKEPGVLGEILAEQVPVHSRLLGNKWDWRVLGRLRRLIRSRRIDALITVGAGDKMFWGRLAAWLERLPVVGSALHSTGWPDGIGRLNRCLTPITDVFIAVAENHGRFLIEHERLPVKKVRVIPNGIDTQHFQPQPDRGRELRSQLGIPQLAPVVGIVAALRPEKNHELFLQAAAKVRNTLPEARFILVGDGPMRPSLEQLVKTLGLHDRVQFLGNRSDVPDVLSAIDLLALTSHNEANPVSILEALSCGVPVVSTRVGSVHETVQHGVTGFLTEPGSVDQIVTHWLELLRDDGLRRRMGIAGRQLVSDNWSLDRMVSGYEQLVCEIYASKCSSASRSPLFSLSGGPVPPGARLVS
jgi:glycosyltransferase involved in cell wall biosynthesis